MKIKTNELIGAALDWAVAECEGEEVQLVKGQLETCWTDNGWKPSANWAQGGAIIERERITIWAFDDVTWRAQLDTTTDPLEAHTPLIAAMRCYVASKCGDEIEIPEELK